MIRNKKGDLEWLEFELLEGLPGVSHGVFLRHGGVSEGPFGTLNVTKGKGDPDSNVEENRRRIMNALGIDQLAIGYQVHGSNVEHVTHELGSVKECDGLITSTKERGLLVMHADCQAVIFYDPMKKVIANIHAGWRGQFQNIYQKTLDKMSGLYGSKPEDVLVCISPSLGPVRGEFINYKHEIPEEYWDFQVKPTYFDLWAIAEKQVKSCGILPHHLEIARIDTYGNENDFFSYRRNQITGNHGTVVALSSGGKV